MVQSRRRPITTLKARGKQTVLVLPKDICTRAALNLGDAVVLDVIQGSVIVTKMAVPQPTVFAVQEGEQSA